MKGKGRKCIHCLTEIDYIAKRAHCSLCGPVDIHVRQHDGAITCAEYSRAKSRNRYANLTLEDKRALSLALHGLTHADLARMVTLQNGCAICHTDTPGGRWNAWCIDHDHKCCPGPNSCGTCVRGILCHACNVGLGWFRDSQSLLMEAGAYVSRTRGPGVAPTDLT